MQRVFHATLMLIICERSLLHFYIEQTSLAHFELNSVLISHSSNVLCCEEKERSKIYMKHSSLREKASEVEESVYIKKNVDRRH